MKPQDAWDKLLEGNHRFVTEQREHPNQDSAHRTKLAEGQNPHALIFGCSDSRLAAEMIFDVGLGDIFVVRTAGQVTDSTVLGSIEFGVSVLEIPLIVILGHNSCGAVIATCDSIDSGNTPPGNLATIVKKIAPSVEKSLHGTADVDEACKEHIKDTCTELLKADPVRTALELGNLAIVGAFYSLDKGSIEIVTTHGPLEGM